MNVQVTIADEYSTAPIAAFSGTKLLLLGGQAREEAIALSIAKGGVESYLGLDNLVRWSAHLIVSGVKENATQEQIENAKSWLVKLGPFKTPKETKVNGVVTKVEFE